jgi:hypothetical protein
MSATNIEYIHLTVWNMNGGPVPPDTLKGLTEAVESLIQAATEKSGTRLLYDVSVDDSKAGA